MKYQNIKEVAEALKNGELHLSHSSFEAFWESPRNFMRYKLREIETTDAMIQGQLKHVAVLEPERLEELFTWFEGDVTPASSNQKLFAQTLADTADWEQAMKAGYKASGKNGYTDRDREKAKALADELAPYSQWINSKGEKTVVKKEWVDTALQIAEFLQANRASRFVLDQVGETEKGIEWEFGQYSPDRSFNWRGRLDGVGDAIICDLKFMANMNPRKVRNEILYGAIGRQAAHYTLGAGLDRDYYVIACDQKGAEVVVFKIEKNDLNNIWGQIVDKMEEFIEILLFDRWNESYDAWTPSGIWKTSDFI